MRGTNAVRRKLLLGGIAAAAMPRWARADDYPSRPVRMIVPWPAGGVSDVVTRRVTPHLEAFLGQPFVVENRGGASGQLGAQFVRRAASDGYTLLRGDFVCFVLAPLFFEEPMYDPVKDFTPIGMHGRSPMLLLVPSSLPVRNLDEFIALARSQPGTLNYAGLLPSTAHIMMERLKKAAGIDLRMVSYKGDGPALADLVAGHVQAMFAFTGAAVPFVKAGKLKALLVTGDQPIPTLPDVPTVRDVRLPELAFSAWGAFFAPASTPRPVVNKLNAAIGRALRLPEIQKVSRDAGAEPMPSTPEECAEHLRADLAKWGPQIRAMSMRS